MPSTKNIIAKKDFGESVALIIERDFWLFLNWSAEEPRIEEIEITPIKEDRIPINKYFKVSSSNMIKVYYKYFKVIANVKK